VGRRDGGEVVGEDGHGRRGMLRILHHRGRRRPAQQGLGVAVGGNEQVGWSRGLRCSTLRAHLSRWHRQLVTVSLRPALGRCSRQPLAHGATGSLGSARLF
jgi:hypothetical protein